MVLNLAVSPPKGFALVADIVLLNTLWHFESRQISVQILVILNLGGVKKACASLNAKKRPTVSLLLHASCLPPAHHLHLEFCLKVSKCEERAGGWLSLALNLHCTLPVFQMLIILGRWEGMIRNIYLSLGVYVFTNPAVFLTLFKTPLTPPRPPAFECFP